MEVKLSTPPKTVQTYGEDGAQLQSSWRLAESAAGERLVLEWRGPEAAVLDLASGADAQMGSTELPESSGLSVASDNGIILEERELSGDDGAAACFRAVFRARNERETDQDVAAGLQSRSVGAQWVERQELLEHFMARLPERDGGAFNPGLFQAWLSESDPGVRIAYQVRTGDEDPVSLEDSDADGSKLTLAAAQRYAMGVQYAARQMIQVVVRESWRKPPDIDARCNVIIDGIPAEHRPEFKVANFDGRFAWMRARDEVTPAGPLLYSRTVVYLGVPNSMKPADPPEYWGDGPIDELLYGGKDRQ